MNIKNVLLVDDEPDILELLDLTLSRMGLNTQTAATVAEAHSALSQQQFDLCLTDMNLPDGSGLDIVRSIQNSDNKCPVAVITAYGSMEMAIESLKAGAFDFVSKPVDLIRLRSLVESALKVNKEQPATTGQIRDSQLTGHSPVIEKLRKTIGKLARSQAPVYIYGESGSGKELVAREIHRLGPREEAPFIAVNCGAIPSELMESEFFGHKKGSFTGATTDKQGLFMAANSGTLFLDEVADLPQPMQVKLLRAIQERAIKPVGEQHEVDVDVRILSATHKNLATEVDKGNFRQDLFYRLNVIQLDVPSLRERKEDISELTGVFLAKIAEKWQAEEKTLGTEAMNKLQSYHFPGNVRELENILERSVTLSDHQQITVDELVLPEQRIEPAEQQDIHTQAENTIQPETGNLVDNLADQERNTIVQALEETRWNRTAAAKKLGLTLRQLRYRLNKLNIE